MSMSQIMKKGLFNLFLAETLTLCTLRSDNKLEFQNANPNPIIENKIEEKSEDKIKEVPWKNVSEFESFVQSNINKYYIEDVTDLYNFYNVKRDLPKYGFKYHDNNLITPSSWQGAIYKENTDSIYFYSGCPDEIFKRYIENAKKFNQNEKESRSNELHHYIKHEAAHAFYYPLVKELGGKYVPNINLNNTSLLYTVQHTLVEEGVAEYMAYKGQLTPLASRLSDEDFKRMIEEKNDLYLYELSFILVKPILDIDFYKGIEELIKNPLTKADLNDLPRYRQRRIENLLKTLEK